MRLDSIEPTNKLHYDIHDGAVLAVAGLLLTLFREESV